MLKELLNTLLTFGANILNVKYWAKTAVLINLVLLNLIPLEVVRSHNFIQCIGSLLQRLHFIVWILGPEALMGSILGKQASSWEQLPKINSFMNFFIKNSSFLRKWEKSFFCSKWVSKTLQKKMPNFVCIWRRQWHPTPVLLPGKSHGWRSLVAAVHEVAKSRLSDFTLTFHFHALEKEMATHSSILAWRIPGMREPGGLPSMGSHRVGHY